MPCDSSTFSGESVEYQLSKAMWKPSRYWARPAAMRATNSCGVTPSFSAAIMIGVPWVSSAPTKCTTRCWPSSFCIRWKRTQMSAWMYSIMWPMWKAALA
jgi:hypothetical protein